MVIAAFAVLALPGVGIGDATTSHGASPSDVFMSTDPGLCQLDPVGTEPASVGAIQVEVDEVSHVLGYFTSTWVGFGQETELTLRLEITDGGDFFESSSEWIARGGRGHTTGTVMWAFDDIEPGVYTVQLSANVSPSQGAVHSGDGATLHTCAMSVFVTPVAGSD
jgi:hypothetical protein